VTVAPTRPASAPGRTREPGRGAAPLLPPAEVARLQQEVRELARARGAVILAHNYQVPEIQDVADYVGDSLGLAREAAKTDAETIVFCGVHFMAETAVILSPEKTVLIPDLDAGCSLASSITADQLRAWKAEHPGAVVVAYVNTTAAVKAEVDYCCTSGNAQQVIEAIPADREILFLPDMYLGLWLEKVTGRSLRIWMGECHVHAGIRPSDIEALTADPSVELLVHPECGCASQCMAFGNGRTQILSTEKMISFSKDSSAHSFLVATETGILHRLHKEVPGKEFEAVSERAICRYMKLITLPKLRDSLRDGTHVVTVEPEIAARARASIDRMVAIG
jgi:quinolinate synthase